MTTTRPMMKGDPSQTCHLYMQVSLPAMGCGMVGVALVPCPILLHHATQLHDNYMMIYGGPHRCAAAESRGDGSGPFIHWPTLRYLRTAEYWT